jgi:hypothetical protein
VVYFYIRGQRVEHEIRGFLMSLAAILVPRLRYGTSSLERSEIGFVTEDQNESVGNKRATVLRERENMLCLGGRGVVVFPQASLTFDDMLHHHPSRDYQATSRLFRVRVKGSLV